MINNCHLHNGQVEKGDDIATPIEMREWMMCYMQQQARVGAIL